MIKVLGALLVAGGMAFIGASAAASLDRRVRAIRALAGALELMEREFSFQLPSTEYLFESLAGRAPSPADAFFARCRDGLAALGEKPLAQIWQEALDEVPMGLRQQDRETLAGLGEILGRYDGEGQRAALARIRAQLEQDLVQAGADRDRQGRMYRVLGLAVGAFLVIVLL